MSGHVARHHGNDEPSFLVADMPFSVLISLPRSHPQCWKVPPGGADAVKLGLGAKRARWPIAKSRNGSFPAHTPER